MAEDRSWVPSTLCFQTLYTPPAANVVPLPKRLVDCFYRPMPPPYPCRPQYPFWNPRPIIPAFCYIAKGPSDPPLAYAVRPGHQSASVALAWSMGLLS